MDLRGRLNQILQVGSSQEISEIDKFAMVLVLHVDDAPSVLTSTDLLASNNDRLLRPNYSEGNDILNSPSVATPQDMWPNSVP